MPICFNFKYLTCWKHIDSEVNTQIVYQQCVCAYYVLIRERGAPEQLCLAQGPWGEISVWMIKGWWGPSFWTRSALILQCLEPWRESGVWTLYRQVWECVSSRQTLLLCLHSLFVFSHVVRLIQLATTVGGQLLILHSFQLVRCHQFNWSLISMSIILARFPHLLTN